MEVADRTPQATTAPPSRDLALLHTLASTIVSATNVVQTEYCGALPYVLHARNDAGHARRILLFQRPEHLRERPCTFVGFIGAKHPQIAPAIVDEVISADERIMEALIGQHDILGYASLELADRNWCNLVLFRHPAASTLLRDHEGHRYAAHELAPRFYQWIHLYHGQLPQGIVAHNDALTVTKFQRYTFGGTDAADR